MHFYNEAGRWRTCHLQIIEFTSFPLSQHFPQSQCNVNLPSISILRFLFIVSDRTRSAKLAICIRGDTGGAQPPATPPNERLNGTAIQGISLPPHHFKVLNQQTTLASGANIKRQRIIFHSQEVIHQRINYRIKGRPPAPFAAFIRW